MKYQFTMTEERREPGSGLGIRGERRTRFRVRN